MDHESDDASFVDDEPTSTRRRLLRWVVTLTALLAYVMAFMVAGFMLLYWTTDFGAEVRHAVTSMLERWGDDE